MHQFDWKPKIGDPTLWVGKGRFMSLHQQVYKQPDNRLLPELAAKNKRDSDCGNRKVRLFNIGR
jgi:hypothetical protein